MNHIENRVIVITGAAGGFGRIVACKAAQLGAQIVVVDINEDGLNDTFQTIASDGGNAISCYADVTDAADMMRVMSDAVEAYGRVDVLVNNAGIMPLAFLSDHAKAMEAWSRCIDINFKGVLNGIAAAHDHMIKQGRGHIINISSIYGNTPVAGSAVYGATKAAVNFLSESLRQESLGKIKVTTIRPTGVVATGLSATVVDPNASIGSLGVHMKDYVNRITSIFEGTGRDEWTDSENIEYLMLSPDLLADQIIYAINQPWGVSIGDITVRASGDMFLI
ncbi:MAG: SDR family oxidoreductase [Maricaulaceae bacterium]